jgi:hypothetical protein
LGKLIESGCFYLLFVLLSIIAIWMAFPPLRDLFQNTKQTDYYFRLSVGAVGFFAQRTSSWPPRGFLDIAARPAVVFHHDQERMKSANCSERKDLWPEP